jgi:cyclic pyranopterin phosphate synthase
MPKDGISLTNKSQLMTHEEVIEIAEKFIQSGVKKIRFTGGEPLIKKGIEKIFKELSKHDVELGITTNGVLLDKYKDIFKQYGIKKINISLDTLNPEKFNSITYRNYFNRVYHNILDFSSDPYFQIKLNVVLIKGTNDDEIIDFINFTKNNNFDVRFIEFMPFKGNDFDASKIVSLHDILLQVKNIFGEQNIIPYTSLPNSTTKDFKISGFKSKFCVISTVSNPFCDSCNRIRLTAAGKIKNCLFSDFDTDLLTPLRNKQNIIPLIEKTIKRKHKLRGGMTGNNDFFNNKKYSKNLPMTVIGG